MCAEEFRLVAQPGGADAALHLVYRVPAGKGAAIRKKIRIHCSLDIEQAITIDGIDPSIAEIIRRTL